MFYLVVDRQKDSENVYFLNTVTESDLMDLAEADKEGGSAAGEPSAVSAIPEPEPEPEPEPVCDCKDKCVPGEVKTDCPVCVLRLKDCTGKVSDTDDSQEEDGGKEPVKKGGAGMVVAVLIALAVGGAGWYFKIYRPKRELDDADDINEVLGRETVNEDEDEERPGTVPARFAYNSTESEPYAWGRQKEPDEPNPPDSGPEDGPSAEPDEPKPSDAGMDEPEEPEPDETWEENPGSGPKRRFEPEDYGVVEPDEPEPPEDGPEDDPEDF